MDSRKIANALEQRYPSPPLHLDSQVLPQVEDLMPKVLMNSAPLVLPRIPRDVLNEASVEYFERTREKRFGMPLGELEKSDQGGENAWKGLEGLMREMAELLKKEREGPFFLGKTG